MLSNSPRITGCDKLSFVEIIIDTVKACANEILLTGLGGGGAIAKVDGLTSTTSSAS